MPGHEDNERKASWWGDSVRTQRNMSSSHRRHVEVTVLGAPQEMRREQEKGGHLSIDHFYAPGLFAYFRPINNMNDVPCNAP